MQTSTNRVDDDRSLAVKTTRPYHWVMSCLDMGLAFKAGLISASVNIGPCGVGVVTRPK